MSLLGRTSQSIFFPLRSLICAHRFQLNAHLPDSSFVPRLVLAVLVFIITFKPSVTGEVGPVILVLLGMKDKRFQKVNSCLRGNGEQTVGQMIGACHETLSCH